MKDIMLMNIRMFINNAILTFGHSEDKTNAIANYKAIECLVENYINSKASSPLIIDLSDHCKLTILKSDNVFTIELQATGNEFCDITCVEDYIVA